MFKGFKNDDENIEPIDETESYVFKLLKHITANEPAYYDYLKAIFAHIVQKPYEKTLVGIIFYSQNKGVGKDSIIEFIKALVGIEYFGMINEIDDIKKKFNAELVNKFIIYGEEITANAKKYSDALKAVITRQKVNFEKKGYDATLVNDYGNWFFTTNNQTAFKVEQYCRRLGMLHCNETKLPKEFFIKFYEEIHNPGKIKQLFRFFKLYKQDKYDIGKDAVLDTEYKKDLQNDSVAGYIQYLYKNVDEYTLYPIVKARELYTRTKKYSESNYISSHYSEKEFGLYVSKLFGNFKKRSGSGLVYNFSKMNKKEIYKILYDADPVYYKMVNGYEEHETPDFTHKQEADNNGENEMNDILEY
jgi:hypothetical protein